MTYPRVPQIGILMSSEKDLLQMEQAAYSCLPVIGIPLRAAEDNSAGKEFPALLPTLETPPGIPMAKAGFNDLENAAVPTAQILGAVTYSTLKGKSLCLPRLPTAKQAGRTTR